MAFQQLKVFLALTTASHHLNDENIASKHFFFLNDERREEFGENILSLSLEVD
jgi:hypothetical protein